MLGLAGELLAQLRVLCGDAHRAGVEMALTHHDATQGDQGSGGKAELLSAEKGSDHDISAGLELAVGLQNDAGPKVVEHQRLMGLGDAELPRKARVLDAGPR